MNLKNIILIVVLFFGLQSFSQLYRFKTSSVSISSKLASGKWDKWSKDKEAKLVISLDSQKDRIIIYSEILQLFDIIEYIDEVVSLTDNTVSFVCKSNDGENCTISIITRKNQNNRMQLYINFDDLILNYNIENMKK